MCYSFETLDDIKNVDIVSICVPDESHVKTTLEISKLNPKIIFLEKPICRDIQDINVLKHIDIPILVNYSRRFSNDFQKLSKRIKKNEFGEYQSGNAFYGKGFIHNGSHMIDLLNLSGHTLRHQTLNHIVCFLFVFQLPLAVNNVKLFQLYWH